jgi:hypothetical protein
MVEQLTKSLLLYQRWQRGKEFVCRIFCGGQCCREMATDTPIETPADRVLVLIRKLPTGDAARGLTVHNAWKKALGIDGTAAELLRGLTKFEALVQEVEVHLAASAMLYVESARQTIGALRELYTTVNFSEGWENKGTHLRHVIIAFPLLADFLRTVPLKEPQLAQETITRLLETVELLSKEIRDGDMPNVLKSFLLNLLDDMRRALNEYFIFGFSSLVKELGTATARLTFHPVAKLANQSEKGKSWMEKLQGVIGLVKDSVETVETTQKVLDWFPGINPPA